MLKAENDKLQEQVINWMGFSHINKVCINGLTRVLVTGNEAK